MGQWTQIEHVVSRARQDRNLHIWGQLYVDLPDRSERGWIVDSWSDGEPYWKCGIRWHFNGKLYHLRLSLHSMMSESDLVPLQEETEASQGRLDFIRASVSQWEKELTADERRSVPTI